MPDQKKIMALSGSTCRQSTNGHFIQAMGNLEKGVFDVRLFEGLADIPAFNPDLDDENPPATVADFRRRLREADGIWICTPEYAMGVPGALKNAIDWTVSSCEFSHKPVALVTASSQGQNGHESLLKTLKIIESNITDETQLVIPYARTKISPDGTITDAGTLNKVRALLSAFEKLIFPPCAR